MATRSGTARDPLLVLETGTTEKPQVRHVHSSVGHFGTAMCDLKPTCISSSSWRSGVALPRGCRRTGHRHRPARPAQNEEDLQGGGLLCREVLITVAEHCYDDAKHSTVDGVQPSATDAKRMLEAIFAAELAASENAEARAYSRAAVRLSYALQHKRTATFEMAAICLEATVSVVNLLAIVFGRRTPA